VFTKPASKSFYVQRTSKTTFMLASLFSPSAVFKPPDSCNYIWRVWLKTICHSQIYSMPRG
jgi:hypothetical protein